MRFLSALPLLALIAAFPVAAEAQSSVEGRVDRLEREMRAVQRKIFPGGAPNQVEPQIVAPQGPVEAPGTPAGSPIANLTERVSALEAQQAALTGQIEQAQFRVRQLEEGFNAYKAATDERLRKLESGAVAQVGGAGAPEMIDGTVDTRPAPSRGPGNGGGVLGAPGAETRAPAGNAARRDAVAAVERPSTGDAAEDGYVYGFRLWQAKLYPEAQAQLKTVVDKYPAHRRASWAQNLIGRAYLDEGKPSLASIAFYDNYKKMPEGERAPDSLYYLAQALVQLKKPKEACDVYGELTDVYGARMSSQMKADVARGRTAAKCTA